MRVRWLLLAITLLSIAAAAQSTAPAQEARSGASAPQQSVQASQSAPTTANNAGTQGTFAVSGTVVNAITGEALPKAKVYIIPELNASADDTATPTGPGRFGGGGFGPGGGGFGAGGGPGGFRGRQRQNANANDNNDPKTEAFTDANGRFEITGVRPGKYSLYAEGKGFPRQPLDQHDNFNTAVAVGAGKPSDNILFRVMPDSGISGHISDDFGDPVPRANVILFWRSAETGEEGVRRRSSSGTDSRGNYHFNHLPPGTYYIVVSAQPWYAMYSRMMMSVGQPSGESAQIPDGDANLDVAFPVTYYASSPDESDATPIALQPGDHYVADMTLNTSPAMHIQLTNLDPKTPMVPNLTTTAFGQEIFVMPAMMRGQEGTMTVSVAPGHYDANIRTFEQGGPPQSARKQSLDVSGNTVVDINKGEEPAEVTGSVKFEGLTDAPRGSVIFRKKDSSQVESARTNSDGEIQNLHLYAGKYAVSAGYSHFVIKSISATGAKVTGRMLEITGTSPVKLNLMMTPDDARIDGVVHVGDSDKPAAGSLVVLVPEDMINDQPLFRRFQSDTDGSFHFTNVIPGKYTVVAIQNGWGLEWARPEVMKGYLAKGQSIEVAPKAKMNINVKAQ